MSDHSKRYLTLSPLAPIPLPRVFPLITSCILLLFLTVVFLGIHQYSLYYQCSKAVSASDQLLFRFSAARDSISESIAANKKLDLAMLSSTLQEIRESAKKLDNSILLPDSLKRDLITGRDLVGIMSAMQSIQNSLHTTVTEQWKIIRRISDLGNQLQQYRIGLSDYTQRILQGLHKTVIGTLGIIIVASCSLLFYMNRSLSVPLRRLYALLKRTERSSPRQDTSPLTSMYQVVEEVHGLLEYRVQIAGLLQQLCGSRKITAQQVCASLTTNPGILASWIIEVNSDQEFLPLYCSSTQNTSAECLAPFIDALGRGIEDNPLSRLLLQSLAEGQIAEKASLFFPQGFQLFDAEQSESGKVTVIPIQQKKLGTILLLIHSRPDISIPQEYFLASAQLAFLLHFSSAGLQPSQKDVPARVTNPHDLNRLLFSAAGAISSETASALTNLVNGSINHIQQLIDLNENNKDQDSTKTILHRMMKTEQNAADLIRTLLLNQPKPSTALTAMDLQSLLKTIFQVLEKPLQTESIQLNIELDNDLQGGINADLFHLITLFTIHLGRKSLRLGPKNNPEPGRITLSLKSAEISGKSYLSMQSTISPAKWNQDILDREPGWPNFAESTNLMQENGGSLTINGSGDQQKITLLFPRIQHSPTGPLN